MTAPAVAVIVVTYNSVETIGGCLDALSAALTGPNEVIVWDNASRDATVAIVEAHPIARRDGFKLVASGDNLGFGGANNAAAARATAPVLLLLNPDAFLDDPASITRLHQAMRSERAGIVGPFLANADGSHQVGDAGHPETLSIAALWATGLNMLPGVPGSFLSRSYPPDTPPIAIGWICGACLMIDRALFVALNGFDERIFLYSEDVDLCLRARRRGARIRYVPSVRVRHIQGVSLDDRVSTRWLESRFALFDREQHPRWRHKAFAALLTGGFGWRWAAYSLAERLSSRCRERMMATRMRTYAAFAAVRLRRQGGGEDGLGNAR